MGSLRALAILFTGLTAGYVAAHANGADAVSTPDAPQGPGLRIILTDPPRPAMPVWRTVGPKRAIARADRGAPAPIDRRA